MSSIALSVAISKATKVRALMMKGASLEKAMECELKNCSPDERAVVQSVTYTATRSHMASTALVKILATRPPAEPVRALLCVALALLIENPDKSYVIVNESVAAAKANAETAVAKGFINACLRRFGREREILLDKIEHLDDVRFNAPYWWIRKMRETLGRHTADRMLSLQQSKPPMILRANRRRTTPQAWCQAAAAMNIQSRPIGKDGIILSQALPVSLLPGFSEGLVSVQDAGAQLAAQILRPVDGERVLDACAAPGGKTAHLLEMANADVTALEMDPVRAERITQNLTRLGLSARVVVTDACDVEHWWDKKPFDSILLDAPCTASGILRRHPDIVFSRRPEDISGLAIQQKRLLETLWPLLKFGGKLLYVVCSVFEEEGSRQIDAFLKDHSDAQLEPLGEGLGSSLRLIPCENAQDQPCGLPDTHDGFFYALLSKKHSA